MLGVFPQGLFDYLLSFHERTRPLTFLPPALASIDERFGAAWEAGEVPGWADKGVGGGGAEAPEGALDLDVFESAEARSGDARTRAGPRRFARAPARVPTPGTVEKGRLCSTRLALFLA